MVERYEPHPFDLGPLAPLAILHKAERLQGKERFGLLEADQFALAYVASTDHRRLRSLPTARMDWR